MMRLNATVALILVVCSSFCVGLLRAQRHSQIDPSVRWTVLGSSAEDEVHGFALKGKETLGGEAIAANFTSVLLTDSYPFGVSSSIDATLVRFENVTILRPDVESVASVAVTLAYASEGESLDLAFTDVLEDKWAPRQSDYSNRIYKSADEAIERLDWKVERISTPMKSSISQVLSSVWRHTGVNPETAGQIILRPRLVSNPSQFFRVDDKTPTYSTAEPMWIIEIDGVRLMEGSTRGSTHTFFQIADEDLRYVRGILLP